MNYPNKKIQFKLTCEACPEQYDAYLDSELIGYLRLRHGRFYVDFIGSINQDEVYVSYPKGYGAFEEDERGYHLNEAANALAKCLYGQDFPLENLSWEVDS